MALEPLPRLLDLMRVTHPDRPVPGRGEHVAIRAEGDPVQGMSAIAAESPYEFAGACVPQVHRPLVVPHACVPDERRVVGGDPTACALSAGQLQTDHARRHGAVESQEEGVARPRAVAEACDSRQVVVDAHAAERIGARERLRRARHDRERVGGRERDLLGAAVACAGAGARCRDLRAGGDFENLVLRFREPEGHVHVRCGRR
jgi:hypothetical protein